MLRIALSTIIFFAFLVSPISTYGQSCGDANGSGGLSISDVVYMLNYIYQAGPPPADFDLADFDLHQEWTVNDAATILNCTFGGCTNLSDFCPPTLGSIVPVAIDGYRIRHTAHFPAHIDHAVIDLALDRPTTFSFQLPLQIRVGTESGHVDSIRFPRESNDLLYSFNNYCIAPDSQAFILGSIPYLGWGSNDGPMGLARVFVSAPVDTSSRPVTLEFADFVPAQAPPGNDQPMTPFIVASWGEFALPSLVPTCCIVPGDADGSGICSISDAVYIISHAFAGGPPPVECLLLGDADGSGHLSISDAVYLITYVFGGGPAPNCP